MNRSVKLLLCGLMVFGMVSMTACSDGADTSNQQSKPVTKEEVKEAIKEASQPGQFTKDALEAFESDKDKMKAQREAYEQESERKKIEAQKAYEELQRKKELEKTQQGTSN